MAGLGETLERTRLERGITLEEAERATHIARRFLQALEADDYSVFSSPVFARGFLRNYSAYLGLDPNEVLAAWSPGKGPLPPPATLPETARDEFEQRTRPLRDRAPVRGGAPRSLREMPGPLTRRAQPRVEASPPGRTAAVAGALLVVSAVLLLVVAKVAGPAAASGKAATSQQAGSAPASGAPAATRQPAGRPAGAMPNLVGQSLAAAQATLQQRGITPLVIAVVSQNPSDRPGTVLQQTPSSGTAINTTSTVTLTVVAGAAPTQTLPAIAPARTPAAGTPIATPRVP